MTRPHLHLIRRLILFLLLVPCSIRAQVSPDEQYGRLFEEVQLRAVFPDSKTFPDCVPLFPAAEIMEKYEAERKLVGFDLKAFVLRNFKLPITPASGYKSKPGQSAEDHINDLWDVLTRQPEKEAGSLIALPYPYIVPGGRFSEIYYWDSYFTMLGLQQAGRIEMIRHMVDNFAYLIDKFGFIPNGNRTYYKGRSQPPFYSLMVRLLSESAGKDILVRYLPQMEKEYRFWMAGADQLSAAGPGAARRRVVRLPDGSVLNRYWDDYATPRPEAYREDVATARRSGRENQAIYRDLRAGAESGWDFSSRWLRDGKSLKTIHTTEIIPVDLNSLLVHLEQTIAEACRLKGDQRCGSQYAALARRRAAALQKYCWNERKQFFFDYDFAAGKQTDVYSLAAVYPLFVRVAAGQQARAVARVLEKSFLQTGGLTTTPVRTGQQWDAPNGWAPLQWMSIQGLRNYGLQDLAEKVKRNWIGVNLKVYRDTGKMVEKYNVYDQTLEAGGGEYPLQDGFGWTNGVLLKLLSEGRR
jgi:alpha,alpha-trehalase